MRQKLNKLYAKYNQLRFIHPDPLEFLHEYKNFKDREIAALIASSLAYGRVRQILKSVKIVLDIMKQPYLYVQNTDRSQIKRDLKDFKHRFSKGEDIAGLLIGTLYVIQKYGSLGNCFAGGMDNKDITVQNGLINFTRELTSPAGCTYTSLIPDPNKGSACKRLNLLLRWMVRKDRVDPGGWTKIDKSKLIIPLDTHMHRIALEHGFTSRKNADMKTALEITRAFAKFSPADPVKYDFALTRPGIGGY